MIAYVENPKELTKKKLLGLVSYNHKVAGYNVNTQKLTTFLYASNEKVELKLKTQYH